MKSLNWDTDGEEDAAGKTDVREALSNGEDAVEDGVDVSKGHGNDNHVEYNKQEVRKTKTEQEEVVDVVSRPKKETYI